MSCFGSVQAGSSVVLGRTNLLSVMSKARGGLRLFLLVLACPVGFSLFQVDSVVVGAL